MPHHPDQRTQLQMQLSSGLLCAGRQWQRLADQRLQDSGISAACAMPLLMIQRAGCGIRQVDLARQLGMEGPSLERLLDKLAHNGLVRRQDDPTDRRAKQLWLTPQGQTMAVELESQLTRLREEVFGALSTDELLTILKAWQLLADAMDT